MAKETQIIPIQPEMRKDLDAIAGAIDLDACGVNDREELQSVI
jgi:hypothetical protein